MIPNAFILLHQTIFVWSMTISKAGTSILSTTAEHLIHQKRMVFHCLTAIFSLNRFKCPFHMIHIHFLYALVMFLAITNTNRQISKQNRAIHVDSGGDRVVARHWHATSKCKWNGWHRFSMWIAAFFSISFSECCWKWKRPWTWLFEYLAIISPVWSNVARILISPLRAIKRATLFPANKK